MNFHVTLQSKLGKGSTESDAPTSQPETSSFEGLDTQQIKSGSELKSKAPAEVNWDGENDPQNPRNWPKWKKW